MTRFVLDTNVMVKWLVDENFSEESAAHLKCGSTCVPAALVFAEVANALWAIRRCGEIAVDSLPEAINALREAPLWVPVSMLYPTATAARFADDLDHPDHDCFYLAQVDQAQYPVVSEDARLNDKVGSHAYLADRTVHAAHAETRSKEMPPGNVP